MGNGMNRVLPGLYVGNYRDSKDASQLERHKITHIIAIHDAARRIHTDKEYLCIMASDSPYQNLSQYFPTCNDFIHNARIQGGNVLIHCLAGMSRSVTIAVAYIMSITSLRWNEALKVVRVTRAVSNPNSGFQKQLQDFESTKLPEERRRLLEKFPGTTYSDADEEQCKKLLAAYNNMLLARTICEGRCTSAKVCPTGTCRAHASPRLGRHKSTDGSSGVPGSPHFSRAGSTKSLDSATEGQQDPGSPKSWERHYGCWKNHFRHRPGTSSTPSTPILYRAAKPQRTDSVTSISSLASLTSLPGQIANEGAKDPASAALNAAIMERNPFLATQSCPNSPRRQPRKMAQPAAAVAAFTRGGAASKTGSSNSGGGGSTEVSNLVKIASISQLSSTEKVSVVPPTSTTTTTMSTTTTTSTTTINSTSKKVGGTSTVAASSSSTSTAPTHSVTFGTTTTRLCGISSARARPSSASAALSVGAGAPRTRVISLAPSSSSSASAKKNAPVSVSAAATAALAAKSGTAGASPATSSSSKAVTVASPSPSASPLSSPWATPPGSPAPHRPSGSLAMRKQAAAGSKNVQVSGGTTRWVMKRSAYRFSLDNS